MAQKSCPKCPCSTRRSSFDDNSNRKNFLRMDMSPWNNRGIELKSSQKTWNKTEGTSQEHRPAPEIPEIRCSYSYHRLYMEAWNPGLERLRPLGSLDAPFRRL